MQWYTTKQLVSAVPLVWMLVVKTNHVPKGVSRLEILRSEPYGEFPNQEYEFFRQSCQHCTNAPCVAVCPTGASLLILKQVS